MADLSSLSLADSPRFGENPTLRGRRRLSFDVGLFCHSWMLRSLPGRLGRRWGGGTCLGGQGSEVHWNLLRNFFVKTILNYCHFSYKNIFWKIVYCQLKCFCVSWLKPSYCALTGLCSSLVRPPRTSDTPMSAVTSALSDACWTMWVQRTKERRDPGGAGGSPSCLRLFWWSSLQRPFLLTALFLSYFTSSFPLFLL